MNFRNRLIGAVTLLTVLTLGAALFVISMVVNRDQEKQLDAALIAEAREEAREAAALGGDELAISDRPGPAANDVGPLTKYAAIYDATGRVLASTPTYRGHPPPLASIPGGDGLPFDTTFANEHLRCVRVSIPSHPGVTLVLAAPRTDLDGDANFLARAMLLVFIAAVAWSVLIATWLVRRLTRHHQLIASVARRVSGGDLSARVHATAADPDVAQLARDVDAMIERIEELVQSQQRFVAHAAHELRSPVTTLYGELSHALRRSRDADEYRRAIEEALDATRRLKLLAEDLLVLASTTAERDEQDDRLDAREIVSAAVHAVRGEASARRVDIESEVSPCTLRGRRREFERLIRNILENGIRHAPEGGVVRISCREDAGAIVIAVEDDGPGVANDDRERVFEPFFRGAMERSSDVPGAGLGLSIAREIARRTGGDLVLDANESVRGARFVAHWPRRTEGA